MTHHSVNNGGVIMLSLFGIDTANRMVNKYMEKGIDSFIFATNARMENSI